MPTRTGYLIKHTLTSARDNSVVALSQGDVREDRRVGLCYTMLLGELTIYSLLLLQDGGCEKRGYLLLSSYPHLLLQDGGCQKRSLRLD